MSDCAHSCPYAGRITKLETQYDYITPLMNKMDNKLDKVIVGLGRVELLELKHNNQSESIDRAFTRLELVEKQVESTAKVLSDLLSQIKGMTRLGMVLWGGTGATVIYLVNRVF